MDSEKTNESGAKSTETLWERARLKEYSALFVFVGLLLAMTAGACSGYAAGCEKGSERPPPYAREGFKICFRASQKIEAIESGRECGDRNYFAATEALEAVCAEFGYDALRSSVH